jgi:hypothetical protein
LNYLNYLFKSGCPPPGIYSGRLPFPLLIFVERSSNPCRDNQPALRDQVDGGHGLRQQHWLA